MTKSTATPATGTDDVKTRPLSRSEIDAVAGGAITPVLGCRPIFVLDGTTVIIISPTLGQLDTPFGGPSQFPR